MSNHVQITFTDLQPEQQDVLISHLAEAGYDGFEENENELKAFITEENYDKELLNEMAFKYQLSFMQQLIPEQNWNAVWESNFQPVIVDDFVAVRANFHAPIKNVEQEIIITPKMSFGTGHHATTEMMMRQMREIDFKSKTVLDFGTGTGILAILAEKLGASGVVAVDNDDWSIANAEENIRGNDCRHIQLMKAGSLTGNNQYDIILANINKNVLVDNFSAMAGKLKNPGILLISGLLEADEADMLAQACRFSLTFRERSARNNWLCLKFIR